MWSETLHTDMNTDDEVKIGGVGTGKYWYGKDTFQEINLYISTAKDQFRWSGTADSDEYNNYDYDILVAPYIPNKGKINDCNEVPTKYLHLFPACNACAGLNYAGFPEGWRLPGQRLTSHDITTNCINSDDGNWCPFVPDNYCAPGRQLWDFGIENCGWDPNKSGPSASQGSCYYGSTGKVIQWDRRAYNGLYWSSTQYSNTNAWAVNFTHAGIGNYTKSKNYWRVRCFLGQW